MKFLNLSIMSLSILALLSACETTDSAKKTVKAEKLKTTVVANIQENKKSETPKIKTPVAAKPEVKVQDLSKKREADRKVRMAKREAEFKAYMEKLKKTDPKRYATEMQKYNEYKELEGLRQKDPKAFQAKLAELRKKQMAEREAALKAHLESLKKTDPKRYAAELKRYNEYKELQELRQKDPKAYQAKLKEIRETRVAELKAKREARQKAKAAEKMKAKAEVTPAVKPEVKAEVTPAAK